MHKPLIESNSDPNSLPKLNPGHYPSSRQGTFKVKAKGRSTSRSTAMQKFLRNSSEIYERTWWWVHFSWFCILNFWFLTISVMPCRYLRFGASSDNSGFTRVLSMSGGIRCTSVRIDSCFSCCFFTHWGAIHNYALKTRTHIHTRPSENATRVFFVHRSVFRCSVVAGRHRHSTFYTFYFMYASESDCLYFFNVLWCEIRYTYAAPGTLTILRDCLREIRISVFYVYRVPIFS